MYIQTSVFAHLSRGRRTRHQLPIIWVLTSICGVMLFLFRPDAALAQAANVVQGADTQQTAKDKIVIIEWSRADSDKITIEYTVTDVAPPSGYTFWGCPVRAGTLLLSDETKPHLQSSRIFCRQLAPGQYKVVESYFHSLPLDSFASLQLTFLPDIGGVNLQPLSLSADTSHLGAYPVLSNLSFPVTPTVNQDTLTTSKSRIQHNGVEAYLEEVQVSPSLLDADVCLVLPDNRDWTPTFTIANGETRQPVDSWELIDWRNPATLQGNKRCFRVISENFDFGAAATNQVQLVVESIAVSLNELITEQDCLAAKEKLAATHPAIQFVCHPTGPTHSIEVTQKPEELTVEDTYAAVFEAFSEVVTGPWIFPIAAPTN